MRDSLHCSVLNLAHKHWHAPHPHIWDSQQRSCLETRSCHGGRTAIIYSTLDKWTWQTDCDDLIARCLQKSSRFYCAVCFLAATTGREAASLSTTSMTSMSSQRQTVAATIPVTSDRAGTGYSITDNLRRFLSHIQYENLAAGLCGGVISTMVLHPLDLVKIRFAGE